MCSAWGLQKSASPYPKKRIQHVPKIAPSALETFLVVQKSHLYQKVVMSGVNNYQQATRGTPDVSSLGAERGLSIPAPPALERCSGAAAFGGQPAGSCSKAGAQTEVKINNAANKSKRNHWHTARLCPGLGLGTSGCSLLGLSFAGSCCQPGGRGCSAPAPCSALRGAPFPGSSLG